MKNLFANVKLAECGYYTLAERCRKHNYDFYKDKYYQNGHGLYNKSYTGDELLYKQNLAREKQYVIQKYARNTPEIKPFYPPLQIICQIFLILAVEKGMN